MKPYLRPGWIVLFAVFFVALAFGLIRGDFRETMVCAASLCLACLGIYH